MSSELEVLKQRNTELEAENSALRINLSVSNAEIAELKRRNAEVLRANGEYNEMRDAEKAKLKARIEELESEFGDRITKVEQNQTQQSALTANESRDASHNSSNNSSPSFNSVAVLEAITVPTNSAKRLRSALMANGKSLEEKEVNNFLVEADKKIVSDEIRQRNREKKLKKAEQASLNQDQESGTSNPEGIIPAVSNPVTKISAGAPLPKNSHRKKGTENISQMISDGIQNDSQSQKCILGSSNDILLQQSQISSTVPLLTLAQLFDKATDAEYGAIHANQEEILCWYYYGKKFITQVNEVTKGNKIGEKKAKGIIYDKMLEDLSILRKKRSEETGLQLPEITRKYLQGKTQKAVKIYNLFEKVGVDKIKYITTYTANAISELTNDKLQEIIDNFSEQNPRLNGNSSDDSSRIGPIAVSTSSVPQINESNQSRLPISILPEDPEEKRKHVIGLVLERFPYLSLEYSESYGERYEFNSPVPCPICNKDHEGENIKNNIKGEWGSGMYLGERAYYLECREALNRDISIVTVKA
jgi:hypothetical protein